MTIKEKAIDVVQSRLDFVETAIRELDMSRTLPAEYYHHMVIRVAELERIIESLRGLQDDTP